MELQAALTDAQENLSIPVSGMTCSSCAGRVEKALGAARGVERATVNLATEIAEVQFRNTETDPVKLANIVRDTGYSVREAAVKLTLTGMTCSSCAGRIEAALSQVPGVLGASINLVLGSAEVRFLRGVVDVQTLIGAVSAAGYAAKPTEQASQDADADLRAVQRRDMLDLSIAAVLTFPLVAQMVLMAIGSGLRLPPLVELALAAPVQFYVGRRFYAAAWKALKARAGNMDQLVVMGTSAAFFYSLWMIFQHGTHAEGHLYFEASAVVMTLILTGKVMEARAKRSATSALRALMDLRPETARILRAGQEVEVAVSEVSVGEVVVVRPGERVPVDGKVRSGESELDESLLTGEPMPVARRKGDAVIAGAINGTGQLRITVERVGADTTLARIAHMVEQAQTGKAPIQRLVDRVSAVFVPVVLVIALMTFGGWMLAGSAFEPAMVATISVLVIACPCALGLATPTALVAGTGAAARAGILIKDIDALERAGHVDMVVFDKTGTLTIGKPEVVEVVAFDGDGDALLAISASVQAGSEHPLGRAMVSAAKARKLQLAEADGFRAVVGEGATASLDGAEIRIGRQVFAAPGADQAQIDRAEALTEGGRTVVWISQAEVPLGLIALSDTARPDAAEAIAGLKARGITSALLTGDNRATATRIAQELGISEVLAEVRPAEKAAEIARLIAAGRCVAMVGDGINDAPALAAADLGIAMGGGADVAMETAGVALMRARPVLVPAAIDIARATARKIRQNLFWAFAYNVVLIPFAALGYLNPMIAGGAMALSSVSVVGNALLLKRWHAEV